MFFSALPLGGGQLTKGDKTMATKYYIYYVEGEDEKLQRKQRCLTDLIESGFLICETGDDVMKEIKFYRNMNC